MATIRKQTILTILLLTALSLQFCFLATVKADTLLVYGSNFTIYSGTMDEDFENWNTTIMDEDFENWNTNGWTVYGSPNVPSASAAKTGSYGMRILSTAVDDRDFIYKSMSNTDELRVIFHVRFNSLTIVGISRYDVCYIETSGAVAQMIFEFEKEDDTPYLSYTGTLNFGTIMPLEFAHWYKIELRLKLHATAGFERIWVDDVLKIDNNGDTSYGVAMNCYYFGMVEFPVSGDNFNFDIDDILITSMPSLTTTTSTVTTTFGFQHPHVPYECLGDNITLTVTAGTLNGTGATLRMYSSSGILTFTNQNNTTIDLAAQQDGTTFWINGAKTNNATLTALSTCTISWSILEPEFWLPLMFILGMFGLASMFGGPLYAVHLFKHHEYRDAFVNGILITAVGFALTIAWLWA